MKKDYSRTPLLFNWYLSWRSDPRALPLADRHYNRQKIGAPQFAPPGRALVLLADGADGKPAALWITSWPFAEYVKHAWAGAWVCSCFRNEGHPWRSSLLIREAVMVTRWLYGDPPERGFVTFVDSDKTKPKDTPGYCYIRAGWRPVGKTAGGLFALQQTPDRMPGVDAGRRKVKSFSKGVVSFLE